MNENVENPLLEQLERFQATLDRVERKLDEFMTRPTEMHLAGSERLDLAN